MSTSSVGGWYSSVGSLYKVLLGEILIVCKLSGETLIDCKLSEGSKLSGETLIVCRLSEVAYWVIFWLTLGDMLYRLLLSGI